MDLYTFTTSDKKYNDCMGTQCLVGEGTLLFLAIGRLQSVRYSALV